MDIKLLSDDEIRFLYSKEIFFKIELEKNIKCLSVLKINKYEKSIKINYKIEKLRIRKIPRLEVFKIIESDYIKEKKTTIHKQSADIINLHGRWSAMLGRGRINEGLYKNIKVCKEWECFENFKDWSLNNGFKKDLVLDRKNTLGDYSPNNCRWVTWHQNAINKKNGKNWIVNGQSFETKQFAAIANNTSEHIIKRWCKGYEYNGKKYLAKENCWVEDKYLRS